MDSAVHDPVRHDTTRPGARVAFFGGSFDPPHLGHLAVARAARDALRLDAVLFAPVGTQPLKPQGAMASFDDRLAMTQLAIADEPGFQVSLLDAPRLDMAERPNYTIDTLRALRAVLPDDAKLFCLMGADSFFSLRHWHRAADVPFAAEMIVASRPGQSIDDLKSALPDGLMLASLEEEEKDFVTLRVYSIADANGRKARLFLLPGLHVEISASAIRAHASMAAGEEHTDGRFLPAPVAQYIREHGLYR